MNTKMIALALMMISGLAQAAWTEETYDKEEDRLTRLSAQQMAEACGDGVDSGCKDLLVKLTPKDAFAYEFLASENFFATAQKFCTEQTSETCIYLMKEIYSESEKDEKNAGIKTKAFDQILMTCEAQATASKKSARCTTFFESMSDAYEATAEARCNANIATCSATVAFMPAMNRDTVMSKVCVGDKLQTPACKEVLQQKLQAEEQAKLAAESDAKYRRQTFGSIFGVIGLFITGIIFSTRCPQCKKFFAKEVVHTDHMGYEDKGLSKENIQTGSVRNSSGQTIATFHQDATFQNIQENFKDFCRCKKCGHRWTTWRSKKHKKRVA